jgi:hypothetical protein
MILYYGLLTNLKVIWFRKGSNETTDLILTIIKCIFNIGM